MSISRKWAGHIYGTNIGDFYLHLEQLSNDSALSGKLRIMDRQFGLAVYSVSGAYDGTLTLTGYSDSPSEKESYGDLEIHGSISQDANLRGTWKSSLGTAGTFVAFPHDQDEQQLVNKREKGPEQLFTSRLELGALRLYSEGVTELTRAAQRDFTTGRAIVTYTSRGNEITKFLNDFEGDAATLGKLNRLKLHIQEPESNGINRVVTIDLNTFGRNEVMVQGSNESWVTGKAEALARTLRENESNLVTNYKKFGMTLNQIIFMAMLIVIPAIETLWYRALFVISIVLLLHALFWFHSKFIPVLVVYPENTKPTILSKSWPTILSWIVSVTSALAAAYILYLLTGKVGG